MKSKCFAVSLITLLVLSSCVLTQTLTLSDSSAVSSGAAASTLTASEFFTSVLEDLSCWTGDENQDALMDVAVTSVARSIAASDNSGYVYISKNNNRYSITFNFDNFNALIEDMQDGGKTDIIKLVNDGENTTLSFNLSMKNYEELTKLIPLLADPNFEAYGPVYNNPPYDNRSEEDYLFMMEFIFGEEAKVIADSTVTILVDTPASIVSTTGTKLSDTSTAFEFRLIDFLLLHEPITFSCTF